MQYLRNRFGIHFPHHKEELNAEPNLPTQLHGDIISRQQYKQRALQIHQNNLNGFEDSALEWLIEDQLNPDQRRQLLERLARPDYANLVKLVADDLTYPKSKGFGSMNMSGTLLRFISVSSRWPLVMPS